MFKGVYDVFTLVINFLSNDWQSKHVPISLFEATKIVIQTLAKSLTKLLDKYGLWKKNIAHAKDERSNINSMIIVLKYIVSCELFELEKTFQDICFGHVFSKAC